ncbi:PAS domain S-box protein [Arcticibacter sp.]|uniref:PAS domain-containing sensor histidine kinase n=1 Tax=Arcticibacter sp. TaxID=1872630 RepID=UPI003891007E
MPEESTRNKLLLDEIAVLKKQIELTASLQEQKDRLEEAYQLSQQRFRKIFEQSLVGNKIIDDQLHIVKVNAAFLRIIGYSENEMLGRRITDFSHPDFVAHWKALQDEIWTTDMPSFHFEACLIRKNGEEAWVSIATILIEDNNSKLGYTILEDITKQKREQLKSLALEQEHRQQIAETILNTQEEERRRVAERLHNGLGQVLFAAKLSLGHVAVTMPGNDKTLLYTKKLLSDCIQECRRISHDLTPVLLEEFGLKKTVEDVCGQLSGDVSFECKFKGFTNRAERFLEISVYRIVQELMMNVVKHAKASQASVHISEERTGIQIRVTDNGKGFDELTLNGKGFGLHTIRSTVNLLTGTIKIISAAGKGTTIYITIPKRFDGKVA